MDTFKEVQTVSYDGQQMNCFKKVISITGPLAIVATSPVVLC